MTSSSLRETSVTGTQLSSYKYSGSNRLVETRLGTTTPLHYHADRNVDHVYGVWDRFGRVVSHYWTRATGTWPPSQSRDRLSYTYDYAGNRTARNVRHDLMVGTVDDVRDQTYAYDDLHRLIDTDQGTASNTSHTISAGANLKFQESWDLDQLGNWSGYEQDTDGDATFDFVQTRAHNEVNEIESDPAGSSITGAGTANWADPE